MGALCEPAAEYRERSTSYWPRIHLLRDVDTGTLYFFSSAMIGAVLVPIFTTSDMKAMICCYLVDREAPGLHVDRRERGQIHQLQAGSSESGLLNESS